MKIKNLLMAALALVCVGVMTSCSDEEKTKLILLNGKPATFGDAENIVWMDGTIFNGQFYNLAVSLQKGEEKNVEKYELYKSTDGAAWTKVEYTVDGEAGLIGGEGARLVVNNGKLYVFSGLRTMGEDIFGGAVEASEGWMGLAPDSYFRVWESTDGVAFTSIKDLTLIQGERDMTPFMDMYSNAYANILSFNGKLVAQGGYMISYGMLQPSRQLLVSSNGKDWESKVAVDAEGASVNLPQLGTCFFELGGKLFVMGGFRSFVSSSMITNDIYCTEDLTTWTNVTPEENNVPVMYQAKVISDGKTAYLFGGEQIEEDGATHSFVAALYKSTDGINWTKVETPEGFEGCRLATGVAANGYAYLFGGFNTTTIGNYGNPGDTDTYSTKGWNVKF